MGSAAGAGRENTPASTWECVSQVSGGRIQDLATVDTAMDVLTTQAARGNAKPNLLGKTGLLLGTVISRIDF